jgi:hypothetical protein
MKRQLPAYVYRKGRAGHLYYCRFGSTTRIHAAPGTPEFAAAYAGLMAGRATVPTGKTFAVLIASYKASPRFAKLKPRTRADYDKVLTFIADRLGDLDCTRLQRRHALLARGALGLQPAQRGQRLLLAPLALGQPAFGVERQLGQALDLKLLERICHVATRVPASLVLSGPQPGNGLRLLRHSPP